MGWVIKEWDPSRGRGVIVSQQLGELVFDASVAMVTDLRIGEAVHVTLDHISK